MPIPVVWSERNDPNSKGGAWRDCEYSAGLMALIFGGHVAFPKGIYSIAEREALERSDSQPDETGASHEDLRLAVKNRYGHSLAIHGAADLAALLRTPNLALVVQGINGNLSPGDGLRRWDRAFAGNHAVCVLTMWNAAGQALWLDPEAPWRYKGQLVTQAKIKTWAKGMGRTIVIHRNQYI
jgi:hypothetical protein